MDDRNDEPARRLQSGSSPDPDSSSAGLGLGLGFGMQSNTGTINNTLDTAQFQDQDDSRETTTSMPNISAPRSTSTSTFSSMSPRPSNSGIGAATTRGMFGRNIPMGRPSAAPRNNSQLSDASSNTAMDGVQLQGQASSNQRRTTRSSRAAASPAGRRGNRPMSTGLSNISVSASTTMGMVGANTPAGTPSATCANTAQLSTTLSNSTAPQNIANGVNATTTSLPASHPSLPTNFNQMMSHSTSNLAAMASHLSFQLSASSAQLMQMYHQYAVTNAPAVQTSQQSAQQLLHRRALIGAQVQASQRTTTALNLAGLSTAATTFHPFPLLPKELQVKIWKLLIPGPRIIELKPQTITMALEDESEITYERCVSQTTHPVLLHICHDSRYLAKKIYQLCFEEELKWPVYMDPDRDILLLPDTMALDILAASVPRTDTATPPSLAQIKYIIVDPKFIVASLPDRQRREEYTYPAYRLEEIVATYGSLKEIVVLKYPANHHLAPLPPQLNQVQGFLPTGETAAIENHVDMLMRWSATMRPRRPPTMVNANTAAAGGAGAAAGGGFLGGFNGINWNNWPPNALPVGFPLGPNAMNPAFNAATQRPAALWPTPKVVAMTLSELKERMERGEPEEELDMENAVAL